MIKTKKADLSINMIVVVAICIIVLVIIIYLVTSQAGKMGDSVSCPSLGGKCVRDGDCNPGSELATHFDGSGVCSATNPVCCHIMGTR